MVWGVFLCTFAMRSGGNGIQNPSAPSPRVAKFEMSASSVSALLSSAFRPVKDYREYVLFSWSRLCQWAKENLAGKVGGGFALSYWFGDSEDWGSEQVNRLFITPEGELQIACYWQDVTPDVVMTQSHAVLFDNSEERHTLDYPEDGKGFQPVASKDIPWLSREMRWLSSYKVCDIERLGRLLNAWERIEKELTAHVEKVWQEEPVEVLEDSDNLG